MTAMNELRESLREAARRDVEAARTRRRRVRRRTGGLLAVILVGGAAAAGAADLISVGEPARPPAKELGAYGQSGRVQLLLTAASGRKERFGLGRYKNKNGQVCFLMGYVRGYTLGVIERGRFRPYPESRNGPCNAPGRSQHTSWQIGDKTLVGGLAAPNVRRVRVSGYPATPGRDGAWLMVFKHRLGPGAFWVRYDLARP